MTELSLRRAVPADSARLALLGSATFLAAFAHDHPGDALVQHCANAHGEPLYARWLADPDFAIWLVETTLGAPIGYGVLSPPALNIDPRPGDWEVKRLYVLGDWQGHGLGARLLAACCAQVQARGGQRLLLSVYEKNLRAQRFYARQGFVPLGQQLFYTGDVAFTDLIYGLNLA